MYVVSEGDAVHVNADQAAQPIEHGLITFPLVDKCVVVDFCADQRDVCNIWYLFVVVEDAVRYVPVVDGQVASVVWEGWDGGGGLRAVSNIAVTPADPAGDFLLPVRHWRGLTGDLIQTTRSAEGQVH